MCQPGQQMLSPVCEKGQQQEYQERSLPTASQKRFWFPRKPVSVSSVSSVSDYFPMTQEDGVERDDGKPRIDPVLPSESWHPIFLSRSVIICFTLFFVSALLILQTLKLLSDRGGADLLLRFTGIGIVKVNEKYSYLWTYGPTAILTLVAALWQKVDYHIRSMAPWMAMAHGRPANSRESLLVDFISATRLEIIWRAMKTSHGFVFISSLITILLSLCTVASTSLFTTAQVEVPQGLVPFTVTTAFNITPDMFTYLDELPIHIVSATHDLGLPYPKGTSAYYAYQQFVPPESLQSAPGTAFVNYVHTALDCVPANLDILEFSYSWRWAPCWINEGDQPSLNSTFRIYSDECSAEVKVKYTPDAPEDLRYFGLWQPEKCAETGSYSDNTNIRFYVMVGEVVQHGDVGHHPSQPGCNSSAPVTSIELLNSLQWICTPQMFLSPADITLFPPETGYQGGNDLDFSSNGASFEKSPANFDTVSFGTGNNSFFWNWAQALDSISTASRKYVSSEINDKHLTTDNADPFMLFAMQDAASSGLGSYFGSPSTFNSNLSIVANLDFYFRALTAQMIHRTGVVEDSRPINGTTYFPQDHLFVRRLPCHIMQGIFAVLVYFSALIALSITSIPTVPCDPTNLVGLVNILSQNRNLCSKFRGTGSTPAEYLNRVLSNVDFGSSFIPHFQIKGKTLFSVMMTQDIDPMKSDFGFLGCSGLDIRWWRPLAITRWTRVVAFLSIAGLIVGLENLLWYSNHYNGLLDHSTFSPPSVLQSFIPAGVMAATAIYICALARGYRHFVPFHELRFATSLRHALSMNYQALTDIELLWTSAKDRDPTTFMMTMAALLSVFLTIVVSGLYGYKDVALICTGNLVQLTNFASTSSQDNGVAGNNAIVSALITGANLSYPSWTYRDLAFSSFRTDLGYLSPDYLNATINATIPALRPALNCTTYQQHDIPDLVYKPLVGGLGSDGGNVLAKFPGPSHCAGNESQMVGWQVEQHGTFAIALPNNIAGCAPLNYFWGTVNETDVTHIVSLSCDEHIEKVMVETNITHVSSEHVYISTTEPPRVLSDTAIPFSQAVLPLPYASMPQPNEAIAGLWQPVSGFYQAVFSSVNNRLSMDDMRDPNKTTEISDGVLDVHKIIRAQQYSSALRINVTLENAETYNATLMNPTRRRIVQQAVPTHILTGLLSTILLCALWASATMNTEHVLPKRPGSVAAMISLLADSNIFDGDVDAILSDESQRFRMGWFDRPDRNNGGVKRVFTICAVDKADRFDDQASEHNYFRMFNRRYIWVVGWLWKFICGKTGDHGSDLYSLPTHALST